MTHHQRYAIILQRHKPQKTDDEQHVSHPRSLRTGKAPEGWRTPKPGGVRERNLMGMLDSGRVLPGVGEVGDDFVDSDAVSYLGEDEWSVAAHQFGVAFHDF